MTDGGMLYLATMLIFVAGLPGLWLLHKITTGRVIALLFSVDITITIEAAFFSDIVLIAILHVITIPAFFGLIYFDLVRQHRTEFRCFVCGKLVEEKEEIDVVKRHVNGSSKNVTIHAACINVDSKQRKAFSSRLFRKGIPE